MPVDLRSRHRRRLALILWVSLGIWAAVLWLSSLPPQELPDAAFLFWDKLNHFLAYAVGGWLAASAVRLSWPRSGVVRTLVIGVVIIAAFGILDETFQTLTPGRSGGDVDDWLADVLGATAGALLTVRTLRASHALQQRAVDLPDGADRGVSDDPAV